MRFMVDECTGPAVARWLREHNHEVFSVYEQARGMADDDIIQKAFDESWILITNDRHFGDRVYRERRQHKGIILLRLEDERPNNKIDAIQRLLKGYAEQLTDHFIVVTEKQIRIGRASR